MNQGLYVVFCLLLYYYVKKKRARHSFIQMAESGFCIEGQRVRELREYALKTCNNIIIQLSCCISAAYSRNLNIMLEVMCNNVSKSTAYAKCGTTASTCSTAAGTTIISSTIILLSPRKFRVRQTQKSPPFYWWAWVGRTLRPALSSRN